MTCIFIVNCVAFPLITKDSVTMLTESLNKFLNEVQIVTCEQYCCQFLTTSIITNCIHYYVSNTYSSITVPEFGYSPCLSTVIKHVVCGIQNHLCIITYNRVCTFSYGDRPFGFLLKLSKVFLEL